MKFVNSYADFTGVIKHMNMYGIGCQFCAELCAAAGMFLLIEDLFVFFPNSLSVRGPGGLIKVRVGGPKVLLGMVCHGFVVARSMVHLHPMPCNPIECMPHLLIAQQLMERCTVPLCIRRALDQLIPSSLHIGLKTLH